jgi:hypothetical protein
MSIFNRRNAFFGWAVWSVGKRAAKRKAKGAVPDKKTSAAVGGAAAALGGVAVAARKLKRRSGSSDD